MAGPLGWGIVEGGWRKGPWTAEEDKLLIEYVSKHGEGRWNSVARLAGNQISTSWDTTYPPKEEINLKLNGVLVFGLSPRLGSSCCDSAVLLTRVKVEP